MVENKKFYEEINIARGIGIILVIFGHSFPDAQLGTYNNSFLYKYIFQTIYSFHMALFFMMSGFVSYKLINITLKEEKIKVIKSKFLRLMLPYLIISIPSLILKFVFSDLAYNSFDFNNSVINVFEGINPNGGLWFLYALFIVSIIAIFTNKQTFKIVTISFLIFYFVFSHKIELFTLGQICEKGVFYFFGIVIHDYYEKIKPFLKNKYLILCSMILLFGGNYLTMAYSLELKILKFAITIVGIYLVISLSNYIITIRSKVRRILNILGDYSYDIYLISYFIQVPIRVILFTKLKINYDIVVAMMLISGILTPIIISKFIVKKINILNMLILGNYKKVLKAS
jgi:fucose 4-O-acetylase-like acetyltransferase